MSLLCFMILLQVNVEAKVDANLLYSYPGSNLFFVHPGFANPSISRGLLGFSLNPASLLDTDKFEAMLSFSPQMSTEIATEFNIPFDTLIHIPTPFLDTVRLPTDLGIRQIGGLDFIGLAFKLRGWGFGLGFQRGDYLGLDFSAQSNPYAYYGLDFAYTFTHADINEIPIGDSIPVQIQFDAEGDLAFNGEGEGHFTTDYFVIAAARRLLGIDCGIGLQIMPVSLKGDFTGLFDGQVSGGGQAYVEAIDDWVIDATFDLEIDADSILSCLGNIDLSFALSTFYWGLKKEWHHVSLGLCGEFSLPTFIQGDYELLASIPMTTPAVRIDDDNLIVDTLNKIVTGHATVVVYNFQKRDSVYQDVINTLFLGTGGATAGMDFRIWRFETGLFGGASMSSDSRYMKLRAGLNLGFRTFIPLRAGVIFHFQYFDIKGIPMSALPSISFGGGTDFTIGNFDIFVNLTGNTTQGAASFIIPGIVGGETKHSTLLSLGMGLRYRF
ncbi:MAG: hypothetical protein WBB67_00040 [bacterium]